MSSQLSMFYVADFHASPGPTPGSKEALKITATSGRKCNELLKLSGQGGLLAKMSEALFLNPWASTVAFLTWKPSATPSNRLLFQLAPSMPRTEGTGFGLWATPDASVMNLNEGLETVMARRARCKEKWGNNGFGLRLATEVKMWPTPNSTDYKGISQPMGRRPPCDDDLPSQVARVMWPTPQAHDAAPDNPARVGRFGTKHGGRNLNDEAAMFPSPASRDYRSPNKKSYAERAGGKKGEQLPNFVGGSLNPPWVEWLMGFPLGWTDLEPSETPSSRKSPKSSAAPSSKRKGVK